MNLTDHIESIKKLATQTSEQAAEFIIIPAASGMTANIINRNTQRGENTDGSKRGDYSTKPMYANKKQFVKQGFRPQGKNSAGDFNNGNKRQSMYLPNGYKQLRDIQGRRTDIKNYDYSGDLFSSFGFAKNDKGVAIGFRTEQASKVRKGLEERFGRAFPPSEPEKNDYIKEVTEKTRELQVQIITQ